MVVLPHRSAGQSRVHYCYDNPQYMRVRICTSHGCSIAKLPLEVSHAGTQTLHPIRYSVYLFRHRIHSYRFKYYLWYTKSVMYSGSLWKIGICWSMTHFGLKIVSPFCTATSTGFLTAHTPRLYHDG